MPTEPDASPAPRPEPRHASWRANLMAGLIVTSPVGSIVIGVVTGAIFILGLDGIRAVLAGLIVGGVSWLAMGVAVIAFLPVDRANRSIHKELMTRMETMRADPMPPSAETQLQALAQELGVSLSSTASDEERQRLISQLRHPQ